MQNKYYKKCNQYEIDINTVKCKISDILLVETMCIFQIYLIATVQTSMECDMQER